MATLICRWIAVGLASVAAPVGHPVWWVDGSRVRVADAHRIVTFEATSARRLATCALAGTLLDADDTGEIVLESSDESGDPDTRAVSALRVSTCTRVALGRYTRYEPPTVTARGGVAGITRTQGGPLHRVDTSTGKLLEIVPTPPCTPLACSFRTGSGGRLRKNGISVEWHGAAVWCAALPGRPANACASYDVGAESLAADRYAAAVAGHALSPDRTRLAIGEASPRIVTLRAGDWVTTATLPMEP